VGEVGEIWHLSKAWLGFADINLSEAWTGATRRGRLGHVTALLTKPVDGARSRRRWWHRRRWRGWGGRRRRIEAAIALKALRRRGRRGNGFWWRGKLHRSHLRRFGPGRLQSLRRGLCLIPLPRTRLHLGPCSEFSLHAHHGFSLLLCSLLALQKQLLLQVRL